MSVRIRLAAVAVALLLPTLVLGRWLFVTSTSRPLAPTLSLPSQVGPWHATAEESLGAEVLALIEPDAYLMRRYEAPDRTPIWLYVAVYAGRAGYGKGAHDPQVCYPAHGWEILQSESFDVPLVDGDTLTTRRLEAHLGLAKESVLYWFQPAKRWPAQSATEQLLRVLDAVRAHPQYAFVRISGRTDGGPTATRDLAEFAAEIAASVRAVVDELGSAGEASAAG
jgi:EpsI family protein